MERDSLYGLMAEFDNGDELLKAAKAVFKEGYRKIDAYTPFPMEEVAEAIHVHRNRLPLIVLICGIIGAFVGFFGQYYVTVVDYPLNIGGRPFNSWPFYIPITFEITILFAAVSAVLGMFALNGLPQPYHPVFNVQRFIEATRDDFFLVIFASDPKFELKQTKKFLEGLNVIEIFEVEP